jgi:hypothetical protein
MGRDTHDKVLASVPVNKQAARALGRGVHYDDTVQQKDLVHWEAPPPMRQILANMPDLRGICFGRFVVLGLHETPAYKTATGNKSSGANWVVRCACGDYEVRKAKAIRNPKNANDKCHECRRLDQLKDRDVFTRTQR